MPCIFRAMSHLYKSGHQSCIIIIFITHKQTAPTAWILNVLQLRGCTNLQPLGIANITCIIVYFYYRTAPVKIIGVTGIFNSEMLLTS